MYDVVCGCGSENLKEGSSSFGNGYTMNYVCRDCDRKVFLVGYSGNAVVLSFNQDDAGAVNDWVNHVWFPQVLTLEKERKAYESQDWRVWLQEVFYPAFPQFVDYPKTRMLSELSAEAQDFYKTQYGDLPERRKIRNYPTYLTAAVYPAQVPDSILVSFWENNAWVPVDRNRSKQIAAPEHPEKKANRVFFEGFFKKRGITPTVVPNEYQPKGPCDWYSVQEGEVKITCGPRYRVFNIQVDKDGFKGLFKTFGDRDETTNWEKGIHAWGSEKLTEYLDALIAAIRAVPT